MLKDVMVMAAFGTASYGWLTAIVAPIVSALGACVREHPSRRALAAFGLALAAAGMWTVLPAGLVLVGMMLEPNAGLFVIQTKWWIPGVVLGGCAWLLHLALERRLPRLGPTFELASAIAVVAIVRDDDRTLARVESIYRAVVTDGSRNVKMAPPSGAFDASMSPPWRWTMARTMDRPRPLPDGPRVPARDASTL